MRNLIKSSIQAIICEDQQALLSKEIKQSQTHASAFPKYHSCQQTFLMCFTSRRRAAPTRSPVFAASRNITSGGKCTLRQKKKKRERVEREVNWRYGGWCECVFSCSSAVCFVHVVESMPEKLNKEEALPTQNTHTTHSSNNTIARQHNDPNTHHTNTLPHTHWSLVAAAAFAALKLLLRRCVSALASAAWPSFEGEVVGRFSENLPVRHKAAMINIVLDLSWNEITNKASQDNTDRTGHHAPLTP